MLVAKLHRLSISLAASFVSFSLFAATPQEEALIRVWSVHARAPQDHKAVIEACQSVMDKSSTLGDYLPVVKTLAAWHLLAGGNKTDAVRIFESAVVSDKTASKPLARYADIMARRWLTRLDCIQVEKALKAYYTDNVEYPASLAPLQSLPKDKVPPKTDRFGDPWSYKAEAFSKLSKLVNQRYSLFSKNLGNRETKLDPALLGAYGKKSAFVVARKTLSPLTVEFETVTDAGPQRGIATENGLINGIRFLKMDSDNRFALMIDSECDFWIVASPARSR